MSLFSVGQVMRVTKVEDVPVTEVFKTRVADLDKRYLYIEIPISESSGRRMSVDFDSVYSISFVDQNRNSYQFYSKILRYKKDNVLLLTIQIPKQADIVKDQKRGYLRVNSNLDIAVQLRTFDRNIHIVTKTMDISGGGLSFLASTDQVFKPGDHLQLWLVIGNKEKGIKRFAMNAEVVRLHQPDLTKPEQIVSVKFINMQEKDSVAIIRYCFDRQIELNKK